MKRWVSKPLVVLFVMCLAFFAHASSRAQGPARQSPATPRFNFGGDAAEIPAEFIGNLPFLPLRVNESRSSLFVLDSTASESSIDPHRAVELGVSAAQPSVLRLNGVDIPFAKLLQAARPDFGSQIGRAYEGTLGNDFFQRVVVEIDYARLTVRLYDPNTYQYSGQGTPFPLTFSAGVPIVQGKFTDPKGKVFEAGFAVNTALDASIVVSNRYAESHRLPGSHWKMIPAVDPELDSAEATVIGRSKGFQLGRYSAEGMLMTFSRGDLPGASDPHVAGEIGGGMLRRFTVVLDYPHHQMILQPNSHFTNDDQEDKSGVAVVAGGVTLKTFEIAQVEPKTPAASAGLQKGDIITGIDEDAAADLTLAEIRDLFRQIGHKYTLLIDRNGQAKQVTIQMRRLL